MGKSKFASGALCLFGLLLTSAQAQTNNSREPASTTAKPQSSTVHETDGSAGAKAGTQLYNYINPDKPLPEHNADDAIIKGTVTNMGAGQSVGNAFQNAADAETQVPAEQFRYGAKRKIAAELAPGVEEEADRASDRTRIAKVLEI